MRENRKAEDLLKYLEDKYNKKFQLDTFVEGSYAFPEMYGADKIIAYPEGRPQEVFTAYESSKKEKVYYDGYLLAKWAEELTTENLPAVKELLGDEVLFKVVLNTAYDKYDVNMKDMKALDYLKANNDVNITFKIAVKSDGAPDIERYKGELLKLLNKVKGYNTTEYGISVGFVDNTDDFTDYIRTSNVNNTSWNNIKLRVYGYLAANETSGIKVSEDLLKYYKQVKE